MKKLGNILNNTYATVLQMKLIHKKWYNLVSYNLSLAKATCPYSFDPYTKILTVKVYDNLWYSNISFMAEDFTNKLKQDGLEVSNIIFKHSPKYEINIQDNKEKFKISNKCENYIENTVKKINNKEMASIFKEYLICFFENNNFEEWILKQL